ncbi:MAG TPA: hypothetical protein VGV37_05195 [Aliidongia sp.]|uniref:hypothetical protein n=1 Tax=Aliidongia sp. TaxID=1914230 RepID=UPI002DDD304E|nr:hypothetical protein [Aliidongia sp.]HEV2673916.1 hypothetical protein [Aliidongia sp.]
MSIPSSFGVSSSTGVLANWLGTATSSASAVNILGGSSTNSGGALTALLTQSSSATPSTTQALAEGKLNTSQQRVLQAVGDNNAPLTIPWNATGTEPTTVANIRSAGWLKLDKKVVAGGKVTGGVYELTAVGKAIYQRTGGGNVNGSGDTALTSADTNGTTTSSGATAAAAADANLQSSVSSLSGILGSVGISV